VRRPIEHLKTKGCGPREKKTGGEGLNQKRKRIRNLQEKFPTERLRGGEKKSDRVQNKIGLEKKWIKLRYSYSRNRYPFNIKYSNQKQNWVFTPEMTLQEVLLN